MNALEWFKKYHNVVIYIDIMLTSSDVETIISGSALLAVYSSTSYFLLNNANPDICFIYTCLVKILFIL